MKSAIVVVLLVNIEFGTRVFGIEEIGEPCGSGLGLVWHLSKGGQYRCCVNITCNRGTEAHLCEDVYSHASCVSCKRGAFQNLTVDSSLMRKCKPHAHCGTDAVVSHPGSATSDVICTCNLKLSYYGSWPDCKKYVGKSCESGHQLMLNGECEKCPPNSYQNSSSQSQCSLCSRCDLEMQENASNCTAVSDTICKNKTLGHNLDEVNYVSGEQSLLPIILGVFVPVMVVAVAMIMLLCLKKRRNGGASKLGASVSSGSTSHSDPSIENGPEIDQYDGNRLRQEVKGNHYQRKTEVDDNLLRRSSLCESDIHQMKSKSDFDDHRRSDSEGLLNSPSDDIIESPVNLVDERENLRDREDNQQSVQYIVETAGLSANERTDSLPSSPRNATVMKGKCNVNKGNVYHFENCNNIRIVQPN